jgi:hypothetical protein
LIQNHIKNLNEGLPEFYFRIYISKINPIKKTIYFTTLCTKTRSQIQKITYCRYFQPFSSLTRRFPPPNKIFLNYLFTGSRSMLAQTDRRLFSDCCINETLPLLLLSFFASFPFLLFGSFNLLLPWRHRLPPLPFDQFFFRNLLLLSSFSVLFLSFSPSMTPFSAKTFRSCRRELPTRLVIIGVSEVRRVRYIPGLSEDRVIITALFTPPLSLPPRPLL